LSTCARTPLETTAEYIPCGTMFRSQFAELFQLSSLPFGPFAVPVMVIAGLLPALIVMVVSSGSAVVVSRTPPTGVCRSALALTCRISVPVDVGSICTLKTPKVVSVTVPMVAVAVPPFSKSAAVTVV